MQRHYQEQLLDRQSQDEDDDDRSLEQHRANSNSPRAYSRGYQPPQAVKYHDEPAVRFEDSAKGCHGKDDSSDDEEDGNDGVMKLQNLKNLHAAGLISDGSYEARRNQLINQMTGTTLQRDNTRVKGGGTIIMGSNSFQAPSVSNRPPPSFEGIEPERAVKYSFDITTRKWEKSKITIRLDTTPFAQGKLRLAYHLQMPEEGNSAPTEPVPRTGTKIREKGSLASFVAKISLNPNEDKEIYFVDVEMQSVAQFYALKFNLLKPPKPVEFITAHLLELEEREGAPLCGVEKYIDGPYRKHNNNYGFVNNENERSTPQAFSHYSLVASNGDLLICDIQGVSDLYTDPQVHTRDGKGYGKGNLGQRGIDKFLETHRCNPICRFLKLSAMNGSSYNDIGTKPQDREYIEEENVPVVVIKDFPKRTERVIVPAEPEPAPESRCCVIL